MNQYVRRIRLQLMSLGLALLASAGTLEPVRAEPLIDACTLLTRHEAAAALGIAVDAGVHPIAAEPRMCNWRESNKPIGPGRNVMLTLITANEFERMKTFPMNGKATGIGDEAVVTHGMRTPPTLAVKAGTHYFQILVRSDLVASEEVDARNQALEKTLAAKIIKKLG
jgi:hypothetical protein